MASHDSVMVVDDDPDLSDTLRMVLEHFGFEVTVAHDGREALRLLEQGMPRVILLDMLMPIMSGWEFSEEYTRRFPEPRAAIVVLTAADDARARALEVGAAAYLRKPFETRSLIDTVSRLIGPREPAHAST
ncbi:MAG: response regulator [Deltaproteobacteria bacterium]|nr:response regulator [Deltaproteobacteria bacterium]MCW5802369.1 response regulator [Deltaproteobacteria bacterium]